MEKWNIYSIKRIIIFGKFWYNVYIYYSEDIIVYVMQIIMVKNC